jgi:prevent-host-death family protein
VRTLPVSELRGDISEIASRVGYAGERVVLTRHGRRIAALVPLDDLERLERLERSERARPRTRRPASARA